VDNALQHNLPYKHYTPPSLYIVHPYVWPEYWQVQATYQGRILYGIHPNVQINELHIQVLENVLRHSQAQRDVSEE
jgi:hypothetical protein